MAQETKEKRKKETKKQGKGNKESPNTKGTTTNKARTQPKTKEQKQKKKPNEKATKGKDKMTEKKEEKGNTNGKCNDKKCPIHGNVIPRGRIFIGRVRSAKMQKTVTVEWERKYYLKKYERYETRRSRVAAHNPPCINAQEGDIVKIQETRPLSKTKTFAIIEIIKRAGEK